MQHKRKDRPYRKRPTPSEFIEAWQVSTTLRETCSRLGMKRSSAKIRALRYRRKGIPLKQHELDPEVECSPDWEELADYARELLGPDAAPEDEQGHAPVADSTGAQE